MHAVRSLAYPIQVGVCIVLLGVFLAGCQQRIPSDYIAHLDAMKEQSFQEALACAQRRGPCTYTGHTYIPHYSGYSGYYPYPPSGTFAHRMYTKMYDAADKLD